MDAEGVDFILGAYPVVKKGNGVSLILMIPVSNSRCMSFFFYSCITPRY